jgi:hypothetical protein
MNSNALAKLYDRLTPLERLPLIAAASLRGDEAEYVRLVNSAPRRLYKLPDYYWHSDNHRTLTLLHLVCMLDLAALYWRASGLLESIAALRGANAEERCHKILGMLLMLAYRYCNEAEAWRRFCAGLKIDADALMAGMPGFGTVLATEKAARPLAFTRGGRGVPPRVRHRERSGADP